MVNHLRTLLLNELPAPGEANEQYIDPRFRPFPLSGDQATFRSLILPDVFPRAYKNFIATSLARLVQASPFADIVDAVDPRSTLDFTQNVVDDIQDRVTVQRLNNGDSLQVVGRFVSDATKGIFAGQWNLTRGEDGVLITDAKTEKQWVVPVEFDGDVTPLYPLSPRGDLSFRFLGVQAIPDFSVLVTATNAMTCDLVDLLTKINGAERCQNLVNNLASQDSRTRLMGGISSGRPDVALSALLVGYALSLS